MQCWNILLVDDDQDVLDLQGAYFECMGHNVVKQTSPLEASTYLGHGELSIDLLVTDFMMPGMNGLELVEQARVHGFAGPALMISSHDSQTHADEAGRLDVGIMVKPVRYYELVEYMKLLQTSLPISQTLRMDAA